MTVATAPAAFLEALESLRPLRLPSTINVDEVEAPANIAPFSAAMRFSIAAEFANPASAFLVVLYDPASQPGWQGPFRLVAHIHGAVEEDLVTDPLAGQVAWSWLHSALFDAGAGYRAVAGTATRVQSQSFGDLAVRGSRSELEVRASWSPVTADLLPHAHAVAHLLAFIAGLTETTGGFVGS